MDELWARLGVILLVLGVAALVAWALRRKARTAATRVDATGFEPGVYLFSSATCLTCEAARDQVVARVGTGFTEIEWEQDQAPFHDLGVASVPSVLIVEDGGRGRLYPGVPDKVLSGR